jgi:hypothetical protein
MQTVVLDGKESSLSFAMPPPRGACQKAYLDQLAVRLLEIPYLMTINLLAFRDCEWRQLPVTASQDLWLRFGGRVVFL